MKNSKFSRDYITFIIDDKTFAVPILALQGIVGNPNIAPVTNELDFVIGVFSFNGENVPVMDLRVILNKPNLFCPNKTCVLIVRVCFKGIEKLVGFIVDSMFSIHNIQVKAIEKLPMAEENKYIDGINFYKEKMVFLLNLDNIINKNEVICFLNQFWLKSDFITSNSERNN